MPQANSLILEISRNEELLKMSVFEQQEAAFTIRHYSQCRIETQEINRLCQDLLHILGRADKITTHGQALDASLKKTGQLLWDHLFTRAVKEKLKDTALKNLVLFLDEELIDIPWELLYTGEEFLCLKFSIGRVVVTQEQAHPARYRSLTGGPLKMLVLANPTEDLKSAYQEGREIRNQFERKRDQIKIDFKSTHIDTLYVKKNLRDYDIVHFAGHCEYDYQHPKHTGWVFSDGRLTTQDIIALGESLSLPNLVFSNACYSAKVAEGLMEADYQKKTYSLACAFLFSGVRHYIGAIRNIEDPVSLAFAKEFYRQLIRGEPVGESIRLGRQKLIKEYGSGSLCWTSYILYGDPGFAFFKSKSKPAAVNLKIRRLHKKLLAASLITAAVIASTAYLSTWLPTLDPGTYALFLKSKSLFFSGRNQEAIIVSQKVVKKDPLFLPVYALLADTYQRLGKKEEALKYYFDYIRYSEKKQDKKNLASAYIGLGWFYQQQGQYQRAWDFYQKAVSLSIDNKDKLNEALVLRKLAVWYLDKEDYDKALELLTKSSEINRERQGSWEHRYNLACDYFDMGLVFTDKDDLASAKHFYQKSQRLFEKLKLKNELSDYYFNLGEIHLFEKQYQKAMDCYFKGLKIDLAQGNLPSVSSDYDMIAELYAEMGNTQEAEKSFQEAISVAKQISAPLELASAYRNLAGLYKLKGQRSKAREYLRQAQEIYGAINHPAYQEIKKEFLEAGS